MFRLDSDRWLGVHPAARAPEACSISKRRDTFVSHSSYYVRTNVGARRTATIMTEAEANPYMATTNRVDLEIDPPTGLPKLSIELLPEAEPYELVKDKDSGRQSHQAFLEPHSRRHYVYPGEMSASASKVKCSQCQVKLRVRVATACCTCLCMW